jgi:cold shock CspA family protein
MSTTERVLGQVKWFNNKAGYGFITLSSATGEVDADAKDIFVHYSSIRVTNSQYKYLTQGEYVEFTLEKSTSEKHELQANDVSGIKGGKLMCEVRRTFYQQEGDRPPVTPRYRRYEGGADAPEGEDQDGFKKQQRRKPAARKPRATPTPASA